MKKVKNKKQSNILWWLAIIVEWVVIPLYIAAMGYEFDIQIYQALRSWKYVTITYYVLACVDIVLFGYFVLKYKKEKQDNMMLVSVFCCLTQIVLLISKVKI